ncbi:map/microtubule affinity-regulating kinase [Anaeramoeba ignava]|uniref:non-specific serine/threonine protein kinase n=1 Tax=Anaeramoeba ignava TaxID=1746090 RepID=A0A9Q0LEI2_ANAIG|nr:map/microtubule affinity-regulating kinase [Anaeramoeba ignava]
MIGKYKFDKIIGTSRFGEVKLGFHTEIDVKVAIKQIDLSKIKKDQEKIKKEIQLQMSLLKMIYHPNLSRILEVFFDEKYCYIISEFAEGGNVLDFIGEQNYSGERFIRKIFQEIISAFYYCYRFNVLHLDFKLENLLLDRKNRIKISGFRISDFLKKNFNRCKNSIPRPSIYNSPEILSNQKIENRSLCDVWSLGICLYYLLCKKFPFQMNENNQIIQQQLSFPSKISKPAQDLLKRMLAFESKKRIRLKDIKNHEWVISGSIPSIKEGNVMKINYKIIDEMEMQGFERRTVIEDLMNHLSTNNTITYFLMIQKEKQGKLVYDLSSNFLNENENENEELENSQPSDRERLQITSKLTTTGNKTKKEKENLPIIKEEEILDTFPHKPKIITKNPKIYSPLKRKSSLPLKKEEIQGIKNKNVGIRRHSVSYSQEIKAKIDKANENFSIKTKKEELEEDDFHLQLTSEKKPNKIMKEFQTMFSQCGLKYKEMGRYKMRCKYGKLKFDLQVEKLEKMKNRQQIIFKRVKGEVWACNEIWKNLVEKIKLSK